MTILQLHAFLVDCTRRGLSADTEILVDAESEADGIIRLSLIDAEIYLTHDEHETPYVVLNAEERTDEKSNAGDEKQ